MNRIDTKNVDHIDYVFSNVHYVLCGKSLVEFRQLK